MKNKDQVQVIESLELDDANLWESRELGADPNFSKTSSIPANFHEILNKSSNMQMISIRLPKDLISDLKEIGSVQKLGYQALMREVLKRFVDAEKKVMYLELMKANEELEKKLHEAELLLKQHRKNYKTA